MVTSNLVKSRQLRPEATATAIPTKLHLRYHFTSSSVFPGQRNPDLLTDHLWRSRCFDFENQIPKTRANDVPAPRRYNSAAPPREKHLERLSFSQLQGSKRRTAPQEREKKNRFKHKSYDTASVPKTKKPYRIAQRGRWQKALLVGVASSL